MGQAKYYDDFVNGNLLQLFSGMCRNQINLRMRFLHSPHLPGYISREVAVRSKLQVAAVSSGVVHHINLPGLVT